MQRERITPHMTKVFYDTMMQYRGRTDPEGKALHAENCRILGDFEKHNNMNTGFEIQRREKAREPTYAMLPEILECLKLTNAADFFKMADLPTDFPTEEHRAIAQAMADCNDETIDRAIASIEPFVVDWAKDGIELLTPTDRMLLVLQHYYPRGSRKTEEIPKPLVHVWNDQHFGTRLKAPDCCMCSSFFGISYHWTFGLPESIPFHTDNGKLDVLLDTYSLLPSAVKPAVYMALTEGRKA